MRYFLGSILSLLFLVGCSSAPPYYGEMDSTQPIVEMSSSRSLADMVYEPDSQITRSKRVEPAPVRANNARKVHYKGYIELSVKNTQSVAEQAIQVVKATDGYIEHQSKNRLTFRVPVAHFLATYQAFLKLGSVQAKSMTAKDITLAFSDTQSRVAIAKTTLERLQALLVKAQTAEEKVRLLAEIQRVSERLLVLQGQLQALNSLAKYSQLTLKLEPRLKPLTHNNAKSWFSANQSHNDFEGFGWINRLSAFDKSVAEQGKVLQFGTPEQMVSLQELASKSMWMVESADHAQFWASQQKNYPKGDSAFWLKAVSSRIADHYAQHEIKILGDYHLLRLLDHSDSPYVYWIGVKAVEGQVELLEIYFPSVALETRYWPEIQNSLKGGAK